jgi:hypothetical protein
VLLHELLRCIGAGGLGCCRNNVYLAALLAPDPLAGVFGWQVKLPSTLAAFELDHRKRPLHCPQLHDILPKVTVSAAIGLF